MKVEPSKIENVKPYLSNPRINDQAVDAVANSIREFGFQHPKSPKGVPACPPELDDRARREWGRISRLLVTMGLRTRVDRAGLSAYCQIWSRWLQAEDKISAD